MSDVRAISVSVLRDAVARLLADCNVEIPADILTGLRLAAAREPARLMRPGYYLAADRWIRFEAEFGITNREPSLVKTPQKAAFFQGTSSDGARGVVWSARATTIPLSHRPTTHLPSGLISTFHRSPLV